MLYGNSEALISVDLSDLRSDADAFWVVVDEGSSMGHMNYMPGREECAARELQKEARKLWGAQLDLWMQDWSRSY